MTDPTPAEALKAEKLHCPFCGSRAWKDTQNGLRQLPSGEWRQHVWCINEACNILGPERDTEAEAIAAWNNRPDAGEVRTYRDGVERACAAFEDAVSKGYPTPANKRDQCAHGSFGWQDCIACYDEALTASIAAIRKLP